MAPKKVQSKTETKKNKGVKNGRVEKRSKVSPCNEEWVVPKDHPLRKRMEALNDLMKAHNVENAFYDNLMKELMELYGPYLEQDARDYVNTKKRPKNCRTCRSRRGRRQVNRKK